MQGLIQMFLSPPPSPMIHFPFWARMIPGHKIAIQKALELIYYRGVLDGMLIGVLAATLFFVTRKGKSDG